jgi:hypothetical protein
MINLIIWFAALFCPNPSHTIENHGNGNQIQVTTTTSNVEDTGGETGGTPKPPPPPPPPGG